jgi:UDP-N-acetyl-alpha-D-muramoyl-L-alanyl-L-glutamate epimerase
MMTPAKVEQLRRKHPRFIYHSFTVERAGGALKLRFHFTIEPNLEFTPETVIEAVDWDRINALSPGLLELLVFHLGLVEMLSYWKATCSPELLVQAGFLDPQQLDWWTDLLLHGMREFFYVNQIDFTEPGFVHISTPCPQQNHSPDDLPVHNRDLVLMSGGKDSALSVQLLREMGREFHCLLLNPTPAAEAITARVEDRTPIIVRRTIDPRLLVLNQAGYLNGHTPFSAYLAMLGVTCAVLFGYRRVIVANERSADEGNVEFLGREVNHQYSKTLRFESAFRWYSQTYLVRDVEYFSLLRPLYELQIARLFARYPRYFESFTSCNRKQKEGSWCKQCAKCLSTFALLYPFLPAADVTRIFGEDLFARAEAIPLMQELLGFAEHKPFECVGTREEMLVALYLGVQQAKARYSTLPALLRYVEADVVPQHSDLAQRARDILQAWSDQHHLPREYADLLKKQLGGRSYDL